MALQPFTFPLRTFGLQNAVIRFENALAPGQFIPVVGLSRDYERPDEPDFISALGTPVYGSLTLGNTDPNKTDSNQYTGIDGKLYTFDTMTLTQVVIIANMRKNIIKTRVTGRPKGSVKEYIALDDYDVTIHVNIDGKPGKAPKSEVAQFHKIALAEVPIPVTSYYLNQLGIYYIVIEDVELPQEQGRYSSQAFTIRACSDHQEDEMYP